MIIHPPLAAAKVASYILLGTIESKNNKKDAAIQYFKKAVLAEVSLVYNEPRDWLVPARHYLGNALLEKKNYREAEKVFRDDLKGQPNNYTSVKGLKAALLKKGK